jgi:hypothetical protein
LSQHIYIAVRDGTDIKRALNTLHERLWLAGYGYYAVSASGQLLDRSIIDASVYGPERLVFEGAPILEPPVAQSRDERKPKAYDGTVVDTTAILPPLTVTEATRLRVLKAQQRQSLAAEAAKVREAFVSNLAKRLVENIGITLQAAARIISQQCKGVLFPPIVLPFDDPNLANATVGNVLADPARYKDETLADPREGIGYGRCKAVVLLRADGAPWIHSFAHGRTVYELRYDATAVRAALEQTPDSDVLDVLLRLDEQAEISEVELDELIHYASQRTERGVRAIKRVMQEARKQRRARQAEEKRERRLAERNNPRPQLSCPAPDAPWLPVMQVINDVITAVPRPEQLRRDITGTASRCRRIAVPNTHAFTRGSDEC